MPSRTKAPPRTTVRAKAMVEKGRVTLTSLMGQGVEYAGYAEYESMNRERKGTIRRTKKRKKEEKKSTNTEHEAAGMLSDEQLESKR